MSLEAWGDDPDDGLDGVREDYLNQLIEDGWMDLDKAIERMAEAGAKDSLPKNGMFNSEQLDVMKGERLPAYRQLAEVMLKALFNGNGT